MWIHEQFFVLTGISRTFDVCFVICPGWWSLSITSSGEGNYLSSDRKKYCVLNSFSTKFLCFWSLEYRGPRKWNGGKLVLQALRSASSGNFSIAKPGYYAFYNSMYIFGSLPIALILTRLYVSSTACVKALWNYQMPWYMVTDCVVDLLK